ncbi:MAG: response regulator, partial [Nannocystaceae bacterium]|nr:response regulator [Nannocystaceae bacterium]
MGARVLVVDDDPWILRMVTATLQKKDFVVDTAREGRQALERAQANPPDVIISDVMMPVMDGWTFVQRLRGIPRLASVPVIFLTALGKDEAKLRSLGMGPEDFLPKPFRFEELEKRVSAALQNSAASASAPRGAAGPQAAAGQPGVPGPNHQSGMHAMPGYPPGYPYAGPGYPPGAPGAQQHGVPPQGAPHPG